MPLRKQTKAKIIVFSFLMCLLSWLMEAFIHSSFFHELFSSDILELLEQAAVLIIIIASGLYADHIAGKYQARLNESESNYQKEIKKLSLAVEHSPASIVITLEDRIREHERELSAIIDNMQDTYYRTDIKGEIIFASPSVKLLLGYTADEVTGKKLTEFYSDPDDRKVFLKALQERGGKVRDYETRLRHKNGDTVWVSTNARYYTDDDGNILGVEGTTRDITAKKDAERAIAGYTRELEYSNKMKELFIDIMNHDLMNPVNIVLNSSEMLLEWENESSKMELIGFINEASKELTAIVKNASKYSRLKSMAEIEMHEMDLNEVFKETTRKFSGMAKERSMTIDYHDAGRHPALLNPIIEDVFANLISNAIKYGKGGQAIEAGITDGADHWVSYVCDCGEGIRDEHKERVFERFERLERGSVKGQGLGLAICKRVVELHNGKIWIEDNPQGGSIFMVSLKKVKGEQGEKQR